MFHYGHAMTYRPFLVSTMKGVHRNLRWVEREKWMSLIHLQKRFMVSRLVRISAMKLLRKLSNKPDKLVSISFDPIFHNRGLGFRIDVYKILCSREHVTTTRLRIPF